ncbi:long-chain fatty acid--CoA ligase [Saprospiraceae bacterium]|nr:long-chain fatty acid--CoA ligase [Saprospiraceae bacterium]
MLFSRLHELIYFQRDRYPSKNAFNHKVLGRWEARSTEHFIEQMNELSLGLLTKGADKGEKVGIFCSHGSPEWMIIDMACLEIGLVTVPINPSYSHEELSYILDDVDLKYCFTNEDLLGDRLQKAGYDAKSIISFGNSIRHTSWNDVRVKSANFSGIEKRSSQINEEDLATIIYTSGSTGNPKGVMLSHKNIISNIKAIISLIPVNYQDKVASFLPLSHIFERMVLFTYMATGARIHFIDKPKELVKYMQEIKPDYVSSVPRILERVYNEITNRVKKSNNLVRSIVRMALAAGELEKKTFLDKIRIPIYLKLADVFVYRRWRKIMGGQLKGIIVGAAAMQPKIARLYTRAGIPVKEGYGLTETSPVVSFNRFEPGGTRYGTVGIPIPGVEVKIVNANADGSGEIAVKGPNVMLGYYNNEALTKERIDAKGWFHTGDVGHFQEGRFLCITDRKKNIFKTSSGRYIYPQRIENFLRAHEAIDLGMIIGFQKAYITALIIPDFVHLKAWCKTQGIHWTAELYMIENDRVKEYYEEIISEINDQVHNYERIKKYTLLSTEWSIDSGEYTGTLKLKRNAIIEKYSKEIAIMY